MQNAAQGATVSVAAALPQYRGPLGRFLEQQREAAEAQAQAAMAAATVRSMRANVLAMVQESPMFSEAERISTAVSVEACECVVQLQRWFRNVHRLRQEREDAVHLGYEEEACSFITAYDPK
jgi:hypothetical protein